MQTTLIFIGEEFYVKSGTKMSSLYTARTWIRWDWSMVQIALHRGDKIIIRPAKKMEMAFANNLLRDFQRSG